MSTEALVVEFKTDNYGYVFNVFGGGWHVTETDATSAANTSIVCSGQTHLATAICDAVTMMEARIVAAGFQFTCPSPAVTIPNDPTLPGLNLYWQGLAFTPTLSELITTNVLRMTVQS